MVILLRTIVHNTGAEIEKGEKGSKDDIYAWFEPLSMSMSMP